MEIFVTGTDTDVGKTVVTAGLAAVMQGFGYTAGVFKPLQSGSAWDGEKYISPDLKFVNQVDPNILTRVTYQLEHPTAPAVAAFLEGVRINTNNIITDFLQFRQKCDFMLVEGAGGLLVPVYQKYLMRDLVKRLNIPLLIVARPNLGTINHTLLTIEAAKAYGIEILGVIISNYPVGTDDIAIKTAPEIIEDLSGVKILGILPRIENFNPDYPNPEQLIDAVINNIDIQSIFKIKIPKLSQSL